MWKEIGKKKESHSHVNTNNDWKRAVRSSFHSALIKWSFVKDQIFQKIPWHMTPKYLSVANQLLSAKCPLRKGALKYSL